MVGHRSAKVRYQALALFLPLLLNFNLSAVMSFDEAFGRARDLIQQAAGQTGEANKGAGDEKEVRALAQGQPIKRELAGGQQHIYQIRLSADQFLKAVVEQDGIDV